MADLESIAERLSGLTVLEAAELSRLLEDRWGVSAAAQVVSQPTGPVVTEVAEAQTEFTAILSGISAPDKKITVIKEVRAVTGLGLKEAKDFTEAAGPTKIIKDSLSRDEAESIKKRLEEAGAVVTIQ